MITKAQATLWPSVLLGSGEGQTWKRTWTQGYSLSLPSPHLSL